MSPILTLENPAIKELAERKQWVLSGANKEPLTIRGKPASTTDSSTWSTFGDCTQAYVNGIGAGLGFVFTDDDPYTGIDLDKCIDDDGRPTEEAAAIVIGMNSYTEKSPSGRGLHIITRAKLPAGGRKNGRVEMYSNGRYFRMTGALSPDGSETIEERQKEVEELHNREFGDRTGDHPSGPPYPHREWDGELPLAVEELAKSSSQIHKLLHQSASELGYPSESEADLALAGFLARAGIELGERANALRWRRENGDGKPKSLQYFERTAEKTQDSVTPPRSNGEDHAAVEPEHNRAETAIVTRVSDVKSETINWVWDGRVPLRKVTVLDGDPGLGKSMMSLDVTARVTTGRAMPDGTPGVSGGVVILSAEDDIACTIRPRLEAAGADINRVVVFEAVRTDHGDRLPELPLDLTRIEEAARENHAALIVIDPLMAFLSSSVNAHRDQDVRRALAPMAKMAERTGAAVLVIRHLNKTPGGSAIYRGGGSIGIIGAARSGLLIAQDPDDPDRRVLVVTKANLAPLPPALGFQLSPDENGTVTVDWLGPNDHTAASLLAVPTDEGERSAIDEAKDFLREFLAQGDKPFRAVQSEAKAAGVSVRTLERAKASLGIRARKASFDTGWVWGIPPKTAKAANPSISSSLAAFGEVGGLRGKSVVNSPEERQVPEERQAERLGEVGALRPELEDPEEGIL